MFFSLIIPIFNAAAYIEKCLISCTTQDIAPDEYEIILINDGSTDKSFDIIKRFAVEHKNIIIQNKANGGVSSARNAGLDIANGKYIWFIDADDWIPEHVLKSVYSTLEDNNLDMLQFGYSVVATEKVQPCDSKLLVETSVRCPDSYIKSNLFIGGAGLTIFRSQIVKSNKIKFVQGLILAEDQLFMLEVLHHSSRVKRTDKILYNYYYNTLGASNNSKFNDLVFSIEKISSFCYRERFKKYCDFLIIQQFISACHQDNIDLDRLNMVFRNALINKNEFAIFKNPSVRHNILARLCSIFGISIVPYYIAINKMTKILHLKSI